MKIKGNIPNYPDYFITEDGKVYSFKTNKFLKPRRNKSGYLFVTLCNEEGQKQFYLHRLVALVYIPNPNGFDTVDHIDYDIENNNISNLRWLDRSENSRQTRRLRPVRCIETDQVFSSISEAAQAVGGVVTNICACLRGKQKTSAGFHWEYVSEQ